MAEKRRRLASLSPSLDAGSSFGPAGAGSLLDSAGAVFPLVPADVAVETSLVSAPAVVSALPAEASQLVSDDSEGGKASDTAEILFKNYTGSRDTCVLITASCLQDAAAMFNLQPDGYSRKEFARAIGEYSATIHSIFVASEKHHNGTGHKHAIAVVLERPGRNFWGGLSDHMKEKKMLVHVRRSYGTQPLVGLIRYLFIPTVAKEVDPEPYFTAKFQINAKLVDLRQKAFARMKNAVANYSELYEFCLAGTFDTYEKFEDVLSEAKTGTHETSLFSRLWRLRLKENPVVMRQRVIAIINERFRSLFASVSKLSLSDLWYTGVSRDICTCGLLWDNLLDTMECVHGSAMLPFYRYLCAVESGSLPVVGRPRGILITGPQGSGKSCLLSLLTSGVHQKRRYNLRTDRWALEGFCQDRHVCLVSEDLRLCDNMDVQGFLLSMENKETSIERKNLAAIDVCGGTPFHWWWCCSNIVAPTPKTWKIEDVRALWDRFHRVDFECSMPNAMRVKELPKVGCICCALKRANLFLSQQSSSSQQLTQQH